MKKTYANIRVYGDGDDIKIQVDTSPERVDPQSMWQVIRTAVKSQQRSVIGIFPTYHAAHCHRELCVVLKENDFSYTHTIETVGVMIVPCPEK